MKPINIDSLKAINALSMDETFRNLESGLIQMGEEDFGFFKEKCKQLQSKLEKIKMDFANKNNERTYYEVLGVEIGTRIKEIKKFINSWP